MNFDSAYYMIDNWINIYTHYMCCVVSEGGGILRDRAASIYRSLLFFIETYYISIYYFPPVGRYLLRPRKRGVPDDPSRPRCAVGRVTDSLHDKREHRVDMRTCYRCLPIQKSSESLARRQRRPPTQYAERPVVSG